jgi:NDP-sugar pyrophosphorylase family protein
MKAILLAGGKGTRLRPLTIHTPKPIVPIFNRPFLHYQIDLLRQVPEIDEVILSLNYQPRRIEEIFGDGSDVGIKIRYVVEPAPLGTAGAVRYAGDSLTESVVVFNGDVLTQIDLAVIRLHRERQAKATIVLTPVDNPTAYGLVETDQSGNITRFLEKPKADEITTNNVNAGIYVLEPDTFDRIPKDVSWSIERSFFPSLIERAETFVAYVYNGYWIDIGTPDKYTQVHRDIMDGRYVAAPFHNVSGTRTAVAADARIEAGATIEGPCFIDDGVTVKAGARIGPYSVIGRQTQIEEHAIVDGAIIWPNCRISRDADIRNAIVGRNCHIGRNVTLDHGAVLGDKTTLTDFTKA